MSIKLISIGKEEDEWKGNKEMMSSRDMESQTIDFLRHSRKAIKQEKIESKKTI
jgi:hypothetical protein